MADSPAQFAKVFKAAGTVVRPLLGSRPHPLLSGRLMLLEYTGAKSGRRYTFPVGYFTWDGGDVLAFSTGGWPAHLAAAAKTTITRFALTGPDDTRREGPRGAWHPVAQRPAA